MMSLAELESLYAKCGGLNYGEGVTQIEHALQCAVLAEAEGAMPSLVAAALLHDVGHLLVSEADATETNDHHEASGARVLAGLFAEAIFKPVALHVAAKRYLCFKEVSYFRSLSPASQQSLHLQGGPFDSKQAAAFERQSFWQDAVFLRRIDDKGKCETLSGKLFVDFVPLLQSLHAGERW